MVIQVSAGIIVRDNRVLIARRSYAGSLGGMWEFPGGKLEPNESIDECLARELQEELGIITDGFSYFDTSYYEYGQKRVLITSLRVARVKGEPRPVDHDVLFWAEIPHLERFDFVPADVCFARRLVVTYR